MKCNLRFVELIDDKTGVYICSQCDRKLRIPIGLGEKVARTCTGRTLVPSDSPCTYRGAKTGMRVDCGCKQDTSIVACSHPENSKGQAVLNMPTFKSKWDNWACSNCEHRRAFSEITVRNLIYHCCPLKSNDLWRANVRQLLDHPEAFNGRRLIAVGTGEGMHDLDEVRKELGNFAELMPIPNDKELREVVSFLPLLCGVASTASNEATFYAHTKGNSTADSVEGATYWRNAGYRYLVGEWESCAEHLRSHKAVGIHKMVYPTPSDSPFPSGLRHGRWMFCGTFFWFRNDQVFNQAKWRKVPVDRYGAEAWLSGLLAPEECKSVYQKWPEEIYPTPNPYDPQLYAGEEITDEQLERERIARDSVPPRTSGPV